MSSAAPRVILRHEIVPDLDGWVLTEELVPESIPHEHIAKRLREQLDAWVESTGRNAVIARCLAVRWDKQHPRIGVDPDVVLLDPPPPRAERLMSLKLWRPGHIAPRLAIEVVSANHPCKDYEAAPVKYAACGARELWVLDPRSVGSRARGAHRIQAWHWEDEDRWVRYHAGDGPARSEAVQGWVHAVDGGASFLICEDEEGEKPWPTRVEKADRRADAERAAKETAERRADAEAAAKEAAERRADAEAAAKEAALRELAALKAQLGRGP